MTENEINCFITFEEYEEDRFEEFVGLVVKVLCAKEISREYGPYSVMVAVEYNDERVLLTSGSLEGCFICVEKDKEQLVGKITECFRC